VLDADSPVLVEDDVTNDVESAEDGSACVPSDSSPWAPVVPSSDVLVLGPHAHPRTTARPSRRREV
jgi:hypothetical protein